MRVPLVTIKIAEFIFAPLVLDSRRVVFTRSVGVEGVLEGVVAKFTKMSKSACWVGGCPVLWSSRVWAISVPVGSLLECQECFGRRPSAVRGRCVRPRAR